MSKSFELRFGDCMDPSTGLPSLPDGFVSVVITDPPYSDRTHSGQGVTDWATQAATKINYACLSPDQAKMCGNQLSRVSSGWVLVMTDHVLFQSWQNGLGRYGFAPIPIVLDGATCRMSGDGPSSWTVWLAVNRPIGLIDGTRQGAYVGPGRQHRGKGVVGAKPDWLLERLIRDYTQPGDLVCDPFVGSGTTGIVALRMGRRFLGWEQKPEHYEIARKALEAAHEQFELPIAVRSKPKQEELIK